MFTNGSEWGGYVSVYWHGDPVGNLRKAHYGTRVVWELSIDPHVEKFGKLHLLVFPTHQDALKALGGEPHSTCEPTREEIESLKRRWLAEPGWDLAATPGFHSVRRELRDWQEAHRRDEGVPQRAAALEAAAYAGFPGNTAFGRWVLRVEGALHALGEGR